jgi:hypothetical protein
VEKLYLLNLKINHMTNLTLTEEQLKELLQFTSVKIGQRVGLTFGKLLGQEVATSEFYEIFEKLKDSKFDFNKYLSEESIIPGEGETRCPPKSGFTDVIIEEGRCPGGGGGTGGGGKTESRSTEPQILQVKQTGRTKK